MATNRKTLDSVEVSVHRTPMSTHKCEAICTAINKLVGPTSRPGVDTEMVYYLKPVGATAYSNEIYALCNSIGDLFIVVWNVFTEQVDKVEMRTLEPNG